MFILRKEAAARVFFILPREDHVEVACEDPMACRWQHLDEGLPQLTVLARVVRGIDVTDAEVPSWQSL
jgi:hypothetical protein